MLIIELPVNENLIKAEFALNRANSTTNYGKCKNTGL